jgi:PhnB protein
MRRILLQVYAENQAEAFDFYKNVFNATVGYCEKADDGTVIHAELDFCGLNLAVGSLNHELGKAMAGNTMQFCLNFEAGEEAFIEQAYEAMKTEGQVIFPLGPVFWSPYMTDIIDKYGVHWCFFT